MSGDTTGILQLASNNGNVAVTVNASQQVLIGATSNPFSNIFYVTGTPTANAPIVGFYSSGNSNNAGIGLYNDSGNVGIWSNAGNTIFRTAANLASGIESMRIDSSGNVGIGVVPSAWDGTFKVIEGAYGESIAYLTSGPSIQLATNGYYNGGWKYKNTGQIFGRFILDSTASAPFVWFTAPTGTAGGSVTQTQAMTLDSSGNLLVGTNSNIGSSPIIAAVQSSANTACFGATASSASYVYNILDLNTATASGTGFNFIKCRVSSYGTIAFQVIGNGNAQNANNSYGATSDIKLKENIVDATPKLASLMQVKIRNYNLKSDPTHKQIGVIAQELEEVFPAMVEETPDKDVEGNDLGTTTKAVKYSVFVPMLIKAIQELNAKVTALENK